MPGSGFGKNPDGDLPPLLPFIGRRGATVELFVDAEELTDLTCDMAGQVIEVVDVLIHRITDRDAQQFGLKSGGVPIHDTPMTRAAIQMPG